MIKTFLCLLPAAIQAMTIKQMMHHQALQRVARGGEGHESEKVDECLAVGGYEGIVCGVFALFDTDKSGDLSRHEFNKVVDQMQREAGFEMTSGERDELFDMINSDDEDDDDIDEQEFLEFLQWAFGGDQSLAQVAASTLIKQECDENSETIVSIHDSLRGDDQCITKREFEDAFRDAYEEYCYNAGTEEDPEMLERYLEFARTEFDQTDRVLGEHKQNDCVGRKKLAARMCEAKEE